MRRSDRELKDRNEILEIVMGQNVCTAAFQDTPYPYLVPMNYGAAMEGEQLVLYFHGAKEGKKMELLNANPNVSFSILGDHAAIVNQENPAKSTTRFESVCGSGRAELVQGKERAYGFMVLMNHLGKVEEIRFEESDFTGPAYGAAAVWKVTVETITGKRHL